LQDLLLIVKDLAVDDAVRFGAAGPRDLQVRKWIRFSE
jgi:hypothetical protein